jgi:hypothetical protein
MRMSHFCAAGVLAILVGCSGSGQPFSPGDTNGGGTGSGQQGTTASTGSGTGSGSSTGTTPAPGPNTLTGALAFNVAFAGGQAHFVSTTDGAGYDRLNLSFTDFRTSGCGYTGQSPSTGVTHDLDVTLHAPQQPGSFIAPSGYNVFNDGLYDASATLGAAFANSGTVNLGRFSVPSDGGTLIEASGTLDLIFALPDGGTGELGGSFDVGNCP